jgi:hypothetical protein
MIRLLDSICYIYNKIEAIHIKRKYKKINIKHLTLVHVYKDREGLPGVFTGLVLFDKSLNRFKIRIFENDCFFTDDFDKHIDDFKVLS